MPMREKILEVKDLKTYFYTKEGTVKAIDGLSFDLFSGETLGIVGETGSGKTMTALSILGLVPSPSGKIVSGGVFFKGQDITGLDKNKLRKIRGDRISMIFQDPMTSLNPVYTIGNQLMESILAHQDISRREAAQKALRLLETVGISDAGKRLRSYPHEFSGGMRQRIMIAMAIANSPDILIADEPTTALDVTIQAQILELIEDLKVRTDSSVILITHNLGIIAKYASRVLVMYAGKPVEFSTVENIFYRSSHPYTIGLIDSIVKMDSERKTRLKPIKGSPPSLIDLPGGCVFCPRCAYVKDRCLLEYPSLAKIASGHFAACFRAQEFISKKRGVGR
jgi:oligopeptide/dipeptide ABC transporter ATP-binding protein